MAWTTPRTWTDGETVTAAMFNAHVRDNLNASAPHLVVRKTSDETDATSTFQNDDVLTMAVAANEIWRFEIMIVCLSPAATDITARFAFPAGAVLTGNFYHAASGTMEVDRFSATASPTGSSTYNTHGTLNDLIEAKGIIVNGGTAGSLTLQWTNGAAGTATVKANSTLWAVKLA